jgi:DNA-binding helix-turn-helix protein
MSVIPNGITEEIRAELARQKRTLRDLSKASGISYDSVLRKINHHSRSLSLDEFIAIADALNIPASELTARAEAALAAAKTKGGENK